MADKKLRSAQAYSRRQLLANAAIAASRVGWYPCAARRISPLWPLATPGTVWRSDWHLEDAAHNDPIFEHIVVVIAPLAGGARGRYALEDERLSRHSYLEICDRAGGLVHTQNRRSLRSQRVAGNNCSGMGGSHRMATDS